MLIDKLDSALTGRSIGSLRYGDPGGTEAVGLPENSTCRLGPDRPLAFSSGTTPARPDPARALLFPPATATRPAPIASGFVPYSLLKRSRTRGPPTLTRIV